MQENLVEVSIWIGECKNTIAYQKNCGGNLRSSAFLMQSFGPPIWGRFGRISLYISECKSALGIVNLGRGQFLDFGFFSTFFYFLSQMYEKVDVWRKLKKLF